MIPYPEVVYLNPTTRVCKSGFVLGLDRDPETRMGLHRVEDEGVVSGGTSPWRCTRGTSGSSNRRICSKTRWEGSCHSYSGATTSSSDIFVAAVVLDRVDRGLSTRRRGLSTPPRSPDGLGVDPGRVGNNDPNLPGELLEN